MMNRELQARVDTLEAKVKWLEDLLRTPIKIQQADCKQGDITHDVLMYSPPAEHTSLFVKYVEDVLDEFYEYVEANTAGLNRLRADMPDNGHTVVEVSQKLKPKGYVWNQ